jgi:septal ring factor EnvC (AmiA/AmiB activator)
MLNPKILFAGLSLIACMASCVSNQQFANTLKEKDRLDVAVERAHKEIKELKDVKVNLEDQVKSKNVEITKLEQQLFNFKKQNEDLSTKFAALDDQMKKMSADLEIKKNESASLVMSYEQKITELQLAHATASSAIQARKSYRKNAKSRKPKGVALPAALKI